MEHRQCKLLMIMLLAVFILSFVSALDVDNVKHYDSITKTATIKNGFGLGSEIARLTLLTPQTVYVQEGKDRLVAMIQINQSYGSSYTNALKQMEFYDYGSMRNQGGREFIYKQRIQTGTHSVNDYKEECGIGKNGTAYCKQVISGTHLEPTYEWTALGKSLGKGNIVIGIFTDVESGEHTEWIPTFYGVRISEWADFVGYVLGERQQLTDTSAGINYNLWRAQTFKIGSTGAAESVYLRGAQVIFASTTGTVNICVGIWNTNATKDPSTEIVRNCTVNQADIGDSDAVNFTFGGGDILTNGETYALVINTSDDGNLRNAYKNTNPYVDGQGYISTGGATPVWYFDGDNGDHWFEIWGEPVVPINTNVTLNSPIDAYGDYDRTVTFNCSATSFGTPVTGTGFLNLSLDIQGNENYTIFNTTAQQNLSLQKTVVQIPYGYYNWTCYGYNSTGNKVWAPANRSLIVSDNVINSETYNTPVYELSPEEIKINISYSSGTYSVISGRLWYNGTFYSGTKLGTGDTVEFTKNLTMPTTLAEINNTFNWEIGLTNVSGTFYRNSTLHNQTVQPINMSICNAVLKVPFINFTFKDETLDKYINSSIEAVFSYSPQGGTTFKSYSYSNTSLTESSYSFCFDPAYENYDVAATIEYYADGYVTKYYNFGSTTFSNSTTKYILYLLNATDSTSFIIHVRDSSYVDVQDAVVHIQQYDTGTASWITTEIVTTNFDGETIGHFITEDVDYKFLVYVGSTLALNTTSTKVICAASPCTITLTLPAVIPSGFVPYTDPDLTVGLDYNYTTNIFTYTYTDTNTDFVQGRLEVRRVNAGLSDVVVCNDTSGNSNAVITCDITSYVNGTYMAKGYISRTGDLNNLVITKIISKAMLSAIEIIGSDGVLWSIFLLITIVMLGVYRPALGIVFAVAGTVMLSILGLVQIGIISLVSIIGIAIILLWGIRRE